MLLLWKGTREEHVVAEARGGGLSIDNLRPVCKHCNWAMQTKNMLEWMWHQGFAVPMDICVSVM